MTPFELLCLLEAVVLATLIGACLLAYRARTG